MTAGAPTKYNPKYKKQAYKLSLLGVTNDQLADILEIGTTTLKAWKNKYPEFKSAIKKGKDIADAKVAESLYKRACGFTKKQVKIFNHQGVPLIVPYREYYPPDTGAAFIWLKNRQSDKWKDKPDENNDNNRMIVKSFNYKIVNAN